MQKTLQSRELAGHGRFTRLCHEWLERHVGCRRALLTHSCTAALEMGALLAEVGAGDEVIVPSYTFPSTANAFVLRGTTPVFVDIQRDTLNIDPQQVEAAVTPKTKALSIVHYAGVGCDMAALLEIAGEHNLALIEDAAQCLMASYQGKPLGSFGDVGAFSFHESKNIVSGEGGALAVNRSDWIDRAEILWEKGTDRARFHRGEVDKYRWVDIGSSFLPGELTAALLWAQLQEAERITELRLQVWDGYHERLQRLEEAGQLRRPTVPAECRTNGHIYYILLRDGPTRDRLAECLASRGIAAFFHYLPLHSSPAGLKYGRTGGDLTVTTEVSRRLLRLPIWSGMEDSQVDAVVEALESCLREL